MNTANQMAEEIYGLHCDIGRLEKEKEHWHTEFINEHEYAHMMEEQAEKAEAENAKLCQQLADVIESMKRVEERCAKLRELIIALVCCTNDKTDCDQCPMNGVYCEKVQQCFCDDMKEALAEIGIEVSA